MREGEAVPKTLFEKHRKSRNAFGRRARNGKNGKHTVKPICFSVPGGSDYWAASPGATQTTVPCATNPGFETQMTEIRNAF